MDKMNDDGTKDFCPMPSKADAPDDDTIVELLAEAETVAIVGASPRENRTSHHIARWLMDHTPYEIYLVNPAAGNDEIRGHGFYASLEDLPVVPDIVDVFRQEHHTPAIATEASVIGAGALWLQLGIRNAEAMETARASGQVAVQNRCIKVEYARLRDRIEEVRGELTERRAS
jgi:predicted CoA-binding protein